MIGGATHALDSCISHWRRRRRRRQSFTSHIHLCDRRRSPRRGLHVVPKFNLVWSSHFWETWAYWSPPSPFKFVSGKCVESPSSHGGPRNLRNTRN